MTGEHEAVDAVAEAIKEAASTQTPYNNHENMARAAIASYQHHLATRSSDAVVQAVDALIDAQRNLTVAVERDDILRAALAPTDTGTKEDGG